MQFRSLSPDEDYSTLPWSFLMKSTNWIPCSNFVHLNQPCSGLRRNNITANFSFSHLWNFCAYITCLYIVGSLPRTASSSPSSLSSLASVASSPSSSSELGQPYFGKVQSNYTKAVGSDTIFQCTIHNLQNYQVSWVRRSDLHVLTIGTRRFTGDQRFKAVHLDNSDDWNLQIRYISEKDAGVYECQLSTTPKRSIFVTLNVVAASAKIVGAPSIYSTSGETLQLTCIVSDAPGPPDYIFWHHNGEVINYDSTRSVNVYSDGSKTTSTLSITKARPSDSGNYTCAPSNAEVAHMGVHVLSNGGSPAAIQHGKRSTSDGVSFLASCSYSPFLISMLTFNFSLFMSWLMVLLLPLR